MRFSSLFTSQDFSSSEIADRLGVSYKTVQRAVADLKRIGVIERVGERRKGYWRIKENEQIEYLE